MTKELTSLHVLKTPTVPMRRDEYDEFRYQLNLIPQMQIARLITGLADMPSGAAFRSRRIRRNAGAGDAQTRVFAAPEAPPSALLRLVWMSASGSMPETRLDPECARASLTRSEIDALIAEGDQVAERAPQGEQGIIEDKTAANKLCGELDLRIIDLYGIVMWFGGPIHWTTFASWFRMDYRCPIQPQMFAILRLFQRYRPAGEAKLLAALARSEIRQYNGLAPSSRFAPKLDETYMIAAG